MSAATPLGLDWFVEVFHSTDERRLALERFIGYYNGQRPHSASAGGPHVSGSAI
jgi:Integrase core domain